MRFSDTCGALASALSKAQSEFTPVRKDSSNPYFNSKYADLATVIEATRPALMKYELSVVQSISTDLERQAVIVSTRVMHGPSGEWFEESLEVPGVGEGKDRTVKFNVQTIGSASTYARRYGLKAALNIAEEDDDGNSGDEHKQLSNGSGKPAQEQPRKQTTSVAPSQPKSDFKLEGNNLKCVVLDVSMRQKKDKSGDFMVVKVNGQVEGKDSLSVFSVGLYDALSTAKNKACELTVKLGPWPTIADVLCVGSVDYVDGVAISQKGDLLEINDDDIPDFLR